jgi:hypothetical protein
VLIPVYEPDSLNLLSVPFRVGETDFDAVTEKVIYLTVSGSHTEPGTVAGQFFKREATGFGRKVGVQALESGTEARFKDDFRLIVPAKGTERAKGFMEGVDMLPSKPFQQFDCGLFNQFVFRIALCCHYTSPQSRLSKIAH